jgi:ankyrin repeat and zinc finger domain-containing protein 1
VSVAGGGLDSGGLYDWREDSSDAADRYFRDHAAENAQAQSESERAQAAQWAQEEAELARRRAARVSVVVRDAEGDSDALTASAWRSLVEGWAEQDLSKLSSDEFSSEMRAALGRAAQEALAAGSLADTLRRFQKLAGRSPKPAKGGTSQSQELDPRIGLPADEDLPFLWAFLLIGGGHFAGGIFCGRQIVRHKVFHRYTVRKKQGGSQTAKDDEKKIRSAGSHIRRTMTLKLSADVLGLLHSWESVLRRCKRVFFAAPGEHYRQMLFGTRASGSVAARDLGFDSPLVSEETRLLPKPRPVQTVASLPFTTYRPSLAEVTRCMQELATVTLSSGTTEPEPIVDLSASTAESRPAPRVEEKREKGTSHLKARENARKPSDQQQPVADPQSEDAPPSAADVLISAIREIRETSNGNSTDVVGGLLRDYVEASAGESPQQACEPLIAAARTGKVELVSRLLAEGGIAERINLPRDSGETALHAAASDGHAAVVSALLSAGADPTLQVGSRAAYDMAVGGGAALSVRTAIRRYAGDHPDQWSWKAAAQAGVEPLTEDTANAKAEAKAAKRRRQKAAQKAKKKAQQQVQKLEDEVRAVVQDRTSRDSGMSDRERRALAAERRMLKTQPPDFGASVLACGAPRAGGAGRCDAEIMLVPFQVRGQQVCSADCVRAVLASSAS